MRRFAVIIAGGAGTRLWPMSRSGRPKQLLQFIQTPDGPRSLLSLSAGRLRGLIAPENLYVCTGAAYVPQVLEDLAVLPEAQVLGEPMGRDTANAVGFAAAVLHQIDPDSSMAVLTADHIIQPVDVFQNALATAFEFVEQRPEYLLTFGITPTSPATGFGYIHRGVILQDATSTTRGDVYSVLAFKEKPALETARQYVASGQYAWNSGMFVWKTATILEQLRQQLPACYAGVMEIAAAWGGNQRRAVLERIYPTLPKISIDFAVMEKAPKVATVAMPVEWLDVGSWPSFGQTVPPDAAGNRAGSPKTVFLDAAGTLAVSEDPDHLIAAINTHDLIIIHTPRATLVCPAADAERIKQLVAEVEKRHGREHV
jgi:mannose-1-phosphate guanylyltransferase